MAYVSKSYLATQFTNFATRVATVFAKKSELPKKTSDLTNDSNFVVDASYVHTDNNYSSTDKTKVDSAVLFSVQTLTEEQKAQVRANIGATDTEAMKFKGSVGTDGTISTLPKATKANEGFVYKVITDGEYQGISAKVGDTFISNGTTWTLIPSGDEPSGTVTSVAIGEGDGIGVSGSPITSSGTITISNKGVRAIGEGTANGTISVNTNGVTADVAVKGLGSLAYSNETIPTVTDTYSATSGDGMSGKAVASALSGYVESTDVETSNIDFSTYFNS